MFCQSATGFLALSGVRHSTPRTDNSVKPSGIRTLPNVLNERRQASPSRSSRIWPRSRPSTVSDIASRTAPLAGLHREHEQHHLQGVSDCETLAQCEHGKAMNRRRYAEGKEGLPAPQGSLAVANPQGPLQNHRAEQPATRVVDHSTAAGSATMSTTSIPCPGGKRPLEWLQGWAAPKPYGRPPQPRLPKVVSRIGAGD
jgi:hypothetical protein